MRKLTLFAFFACLIAAVRGGCGGGRYYRRPSPPPYRRPPCGYRPPPPSRGNTNCGGHRATSCSRCPYSSSGYKGAAWCNGDCYWVNNRCHPKGYRPPPPPPVRRPPPPPPPVNCQWSGWTTASGSAGRCNKSCGGGHYTRTRRVVRSARYGGRGCSGSSTQRVRCNTQPCAGNLFKVQDSILKKYSG